MTEATMHTEITPIRLQDIAGTSLVGYLEATIEELDAILPRTDRGSWDGKVTHEWAGKIDGHVFTVYDYKWVAEPGVRERFHVGGNDEMVVRLLKAHFPRVELY